MVVMLLLSTNAMAGPAPAPDCSPDLDRRLLTAVVVSLSDTKHEYYIDKLVGKNKKYKIRLLSSNKISVAEKKRLMERRTKRDGESKIDGSTKVQYLQNEIYRQYYEIETPDYPILITEFYSIPHYCGVDLESIYFVNEKIEGFTPDFADRPNSPY